MDIWQTVELSFYIEPVEMSCFAVLYWSGFHPVAKCEGLHPDIQDKTSSTESLPTFLTHIKPSQKAVKAHTDAIKGVVIAGIL